MLNQAGVIFGQTLVSGNETMIVPGPSRTAAYVGAEALLLFADLKEGKGWSKISRGGDSLKKKKIAWSVCNLGERIATNEFEKKTVAVVQKRRRSKVLKVLMSKLQLPAVGCFDGLLKKPFKEILHFAHRKYQSEWRAASACETQRWD